MLKQLNPARMMRAGLNLKIDMSNNNTKTTEAQAELPPAMSKIMNRIYVHGAKILLKTGAQEYRNLSATQYIRYVRDAVDDALTPSQVEQALDSRVVDEVVDRCCVLPQGVATVNGRKILVLNGVDWIRGADIPCAGINDWLDAAAANTALGILTAGLKADRIIRCGLWIAQARRRCAAWLDAGRVDSQMPILVLAGDEGCGKSLMLNRVLCPLINGWDTRDNCPARAVAAARPLLGRFNAEIVRSPLLSIDDEISGLTQREREALFTACKSACYSQCLSIEGKGLTPVMLSMPWCICICCNKSDNALQAIPYASDEPNKILALEVARRKSLPDNYQCITRADIAAAASLVDALPAIALRDATCKPIIDPLNRQLVAGWIDPYLRAGLRAISPEGIVARVWLAIFSRATADETKSMDKFLTVSAFYDLLTSRARLREVDDLKTACPTPRACGRLLKSLVSSGLAHTRQDTRNRVPLYWLNNQMIKAEIDENG